MEKRGTNNNLKQEILSENPKNPDQNPNELHFFGGGIIKKG